jgi:hypothetical protein
MTVFWARMGGVEVSDAMVLLEAKLGPAREVIEAIARRKVAAALAWEKGVSVSERDVEEALEEHYRRLGVLDAEARRDWRTRMHLKEEALRSHLRELALIDRLRTQIVSDAAIQDRYRETLGDRRLAEVDLFEFSSEASAEGFVSAVLVGEIEPRMGERHRLPIALAPKGIAADLASASEGQLLGPAETRARVWHVYRFLRWDEPPLDARLKETIREELFREALGPAFAEDPLQFLV